MLEREREGRGRRLARGPGRGRGARFWARMAEKKEGGEKAFSFLFSKQIFQTLFQMNF